MNEIRLVQVERESEIERDREREREKLNDKIKKACI